MPIPLPTPSVAARLDNAFERAPLPSWEEPLSTRPSLDDIFSHLGEKPAPQSSKRELFSPRDEELPSTQAAPVLDELDELDELELEEDFDFEDMQLPDPGQKHHFFHDEHIPALDETPVVPAVAYVEQRLEAEGLPSSPAEAEVAPQELAAAQQEPAQTIPAAPITKRMLDPRLEAPVWEVWIEGGDPIGPVSADQIARGVREGRVPSHASVKRASDTFWLDMLDVPDIVEALKSHSKESAPPPQLVAPTLTVRQYMVWVEGSDPVGPVSADQIARGIRAGKVPTHASLQRVGDLFATDVLDEPEVIAALKLL